MGKHFITLKHIIIVNTLSTHVKNPSVENTEIQIFIPDAVIKAAIIDDPPPVNPLNTRTTIGAEIIMDTVAMIIEEIKIFI